MHLSGTYTIVYTSFAGKAEKKDRTTGQMFWEEHRQEKSKLSAPTLVPTALQSHGAM